MRRFNLRRIVALLGVVVIVMGSGSPASADEPGLAPVRDFAAEADIGYLTLSWTDPGNAAGDGFIICSRLGTEAWPAPPPGCVASDDDVIRTTSAMTWFSPAQTWTYTIFARDSAGHTSPPASITVRGSAVQVSSAPSSNGVAPGIRVTGRLTDGLTGAAMPGRAVDVYVSRPRREGEGSEADPGLIDYHLERVTTDASGGFTRTYPLRRGWDYQARFHGTGARMGNLSAVIPADGSSFIDLDSTDAAGNRRTKRAITLIAKVAVQRVGDRVVFQRLVRGRWASIATRDVGRTLTVALRQRIAKHATPAYRAVLVQVRRAEQPSVPLRIRRR